MYDAEVLTSEPEYAKYFEELISYKINIKNAVSWMSVELVGGLNKLGKTIEQSPIKPKLLSELIQRIEDKTISNKAAKDVLDYIIENSCGVNDAIEKLGLKQISDEGAILELINGVLSANMKQVEAYKNGKEALIGFFVGQVMKASRGKANPGVVNKLLKQELQKL